MPRNAVRIAGLVILAAAVVSLLMGVIRNTKGHGDTDDSLDVAPIKPVATAQPLTTPPVTETDVRRWAREELQATLAARPARKAKPDDVAATDAADDPTTPAAGVAAAPPTVGATPTPAKPAKPASAPATGQIPF